MIPFSSAFRDLDFPLLPLPTVPCVYSLRRNQSGRHRGYASGLYRHPREAGNHSFGLFLSVLFRIHRLGSPPRKRLSLSYGTRYDFSPRRESLAPRTHMQRGAGGKEGGRDDRYGGWGVPLSRLSATFGSGGCASIPLMAPSCPPRESPIPNRSPKPFPPIRCTLGADPSGRCCRFQRSSPPSGLGQGAVQVSGVPYFEVPVGRECPRSR